MPLIRQVDLFRKKIPLNRPYRLSFRDLSAFESLFVLIHTDDALGLGEATPLPGYNPETMQSVERFARELAPKLLDKGVNEAREMVTLKRGGDFFAASAFLVALDFLEARFELHEEVSRVPLVVHLDLAKDARAVQNMKKALEQGSRVFKTKIGRDILKEAATMNLLFKNMPEDARVICDANKALSFKNAVNFVEALKCPNRLDYLEQPFDEDALELTNALRQETGVAVLLDESVYTRTDLEKIIAHNACDKIKLKLMKQGGALESLEIAWAAKEAGLGVVLGNGVQTDWGCRLEGILHRKLDLESPGEMVGFTKQRAPLEKGLLTLETAEIVFYPMNHENSVILSHVGSMDLLAKYSE